MDATNARAGSPDTAPLDALEALFLGAGADQYPGEDVTQAQHLLQAAALAAADGARPALVAAALLHDIGHFHGALGGEERLKERLGERPEERLEGTDHRHGDAGADLLAAWFGPDVTEPVRLHVAARRYLCRAEPGYQDKLSDESVRTLTVQGGPMTVEQARAYEAEPYARDAVTLRRWDERAKDPGAEVPPFAHYRPLLAALLKAAGPSEEQTGRPR